MPLRILNVDDSAASRYVRTHALHEAGYDVTEACTGREAIELATSVAPDAILLDVRLPDIDGFEVARNLRNKPGISEIPVIFISAAERSANIQAGALDEGADAYLVEPVPPGLVVSTVRAALRRSELERELRESNARLRQELERRRIAEQQLGVALSAAEMGTWTLDAATGFVTASETTARLFGLQYDPDGRPLGDYFAVLHPDDSFARETLCGNRAEAEFRVLRGDAVRWLLWRGRKDASGARVIGALIDITERRNANERARFQAHLLEAMGDAVIATDPNGIVNYWGAAAERIYGWTAAEAMGRNIVDLTPDEMSREQASDLMAQLTAGQSWTGEFLVRRKDGKSLWARVTDTPVLDAAGAVIGVIGLSSDVTGKKMLEQELRESEERFRLLAEHSMDLIARLDHEASPEYLSPSYESVLGYSRLELAEALRDDPVALVHPDDRDAVRSALAQVLSDGSFRLEYRVRRKDGEYLWVDAMGKSIGDGDPSARQVHIIARDITSRVAMEQELKATAAEHRRYHRMLQALMDYIPEGITIADAPDVTIRWVSRHGRELTGRTKQQIEGIAVGEHSTRWGMYRADGVTPASDDDLPLTRATRHGEVVNDEEWVLQRPDGSRLWLLCNAGPILDDRGQVRGGLIAFRDISERRAAAVALAQSEARMQLAMQAAGLGVWEYDPARRQVYVSDRLAGLWGLPKGESSIDPWLQGIHPEDRARVVSALGTAGKGEGEYSVEHRVVGEDGLRWVRSTGMLGDSAAGGRVLVGILEDITDRKQAEDALRASEERLALSQSAGGVGTWDADLVNDTALWSEGMYPLWGLEARAGALKFGEVFEHIHEADRQAVQSALEAVLASGVPYAAEFRGVHPSGEVRWLAGKAKVTMDADGRPVRMLGVNYDITARKHAEDALRRSNEELQQFAYAISHDLQEPLRTITSFTELTKRRLPADTDSEVAGFLEIVAAGARRMRQMIEDLLAYSRVVHDTSAVTGAVDLNGAFDWAVSNLQTTIAECQGKVSRGALPTVSGDFARLAQLLQNLIGNALKYCRPNQPPVISVTAAQMGRECVIAVEDNGPGIPPEFAGQVFLPFKRLHGRDVSGTGLGLAICKRIVERHDGRIWLETGSMGGARICFSLPHSAGKALAASD